jgi:hypothetical protein
MSLNHWREVLEGLAGPLLSNIADQDHMSTDALIARLAVASGNRAGLAKCSFTGSQK